MGLHLSADSTNGILSVAAGILFLAVGVILQRWAATQGRLDPRIPTCKLRRTRCAQLSSFQKVAGGLLQEARVLETARLDVSEVRTLTPLVSEVRRRGEILLRHRGPMQRLIPSRQERALEPLVERLTSLEKALKSLPRSKLSVEDVLAGRFDVQYPADKGV